MVKKKIMKASYLWLALLLLAVTLFTGCTATGPQGWSGCVSNGTNVYYGSLDSRLISINPVSREANLPFPNRDSGEWYADIKQPASGGGLCGPMLCAPSATGSIIYSTPGVTDNLSFIATYDGRLYAYASQTGAERWQYPRSTADTIGAVVGNVLLANGNIYLTSSNGSIYGFNQNYGDKLWEYKTGDRIWTTPAYSNDLIFAGSYDGSLYAVSAKNGSEAWRVKVPVAMSSSPIVYKNPIIFGSFDRNLHAVSQKDGSEVWKFTGGNWFWADPVVKDNTVYAACIDNYVYAVNADTGAQIWKLEVGKVASRPAISGNTLAIVTEAGDLSLIDIGTGTLKQKITIGYKTVAPLLAFNNMIFAHALDNYIYAIDVAGSRQAWKFKAEIK
jgi:eukaryotic-like serine/threonine-protein kinase